MLGHGCRGCGGRGRGGCEGRREQGMEGGREGACERAMEGRMDGGRGRGNGRRDGGTEGRRQGRKDGGTEGRRERGQEEDTEGYSLSSPPFPSLPFSSPLFSLARSRPFRRPDPSASQHPLCAHPSPCVRQLPSQTRILRTYTCASVPTDPPTHRSSSPRRPARPAPAPASPPHPPP